MKPRDVDNHGEQMKTSMIFFGIFTAGLLTGMQVEWQSWLWGVAFGLSVARVAISFLED